MLRVLSPTNQTCVASCINADFWLDKMSRSHTIHGGATSLVAKQVCLGPLKRATCTDFVAKSRTSLYLLQQLSTTFQDRFDSWVVKRATSLLNSFCSKVSKQVSRFSCSFCRTFRGGFIEVLPSLWSAISQATQATKFCMLSWLLLACQQTFFFLFSQQFYSAQSINPQRILF